MKATFSVKNFDRFQHYKDRSPPWIKLYNDLLSNYEYALLPDASKSHLVAIWLLASRSDNRIPLDPDWVGKQIGATSPVDLNILRTADFIEFNQACSETLATSGQSAMPEERESRGRERAEQREIGGPSAPPSKAVRKSLSSLPENFPDAAALETACAYWDERDRHDLSVTVRDEAARFEAHHKSNGKRMADWGQAWVTWYSNAIKFNRKPNNGKRQSAHENHNAGTVLYLQSLGGSASADQSGPGGDSPTADETRKLLLAP